LRILVTGRDGQLAQSLAERAAAHPEFELVATSRAEADLSSSGSVAAVIAAVRPDLVVNAAAFTAVDQAEEEPALAFRINTEGAGEAAAAAREVGAAFIQLSTDYVFDGEAEAPYREDAPTNPLSVYGRSKLAGEEAVRAANPAHLILRTAWVYSPFGRNFLKTMVAAASTRDTLTVVDDQLGSPTSAFDLADGILAISRAWQVEPAQGRGNIFHLAGPEQVSWCAFARTIMEECRQLGLPAAEVKPIKTADWPTAARRPPNSALDSGNFARDFGFSMPELRASVRTVVERLASRP
jgi:dTDP-4-dehydrorhamnose reductase